MHTTAYKKYRPLIIIFWLVLMALFILFWHIDNSYKKIDGAVTPNCHIKTNSCTFSVNNEQYTVRFSPAPQIEERLTITIIGTKTHNLRRAYIEGVNYYMGKIPVIREEVDATNRWQGWTMLGACSEPRMIWHMVLSFNDTDQRAVVQFTTQI